jgi:hypothetical protein
MSNSKREESKVKMDEDAAEKLGLDPAHFYTGGAVTRELYEAIKKMYDDATKEEVADLAVEASGGDPNNTGTSTGGTETKETLRELDRATSDND